jgi:hypothetical protein
VFSADEKVGFGAGYGSHATIVGPNGAGAVLSKFSLSFPYSFARFVKINGRSGAHETAFRFLGTNPCVCSEEARGFPRGAKFGTPKTFFQSGGAGLKARSGTGSFSTHHMTTNFNTTDRYLLFKFTGVHLPHSVYGWAQFAVSFPGPGGGPDVTLINYAYDTSGVQIPAGYGARTTPEPSTFALAALALGATGLRKWRAARRAA